MDEWEFVKDNAVVLCKIRFRETSPGCQKLREDLKRFDGFEFVGTVILIQDDRYDGERGVRIHDRRKSRSSLKKTTNLMEKTRWIATGDLQLLQILE